MRENYYFTLLIQNLNGYLKLSERTIIYIPPEIQRNFHKEWKIIPRNYKNEQT